MLVSAQGLEPWTYRLKVLVDALQGREIDPACCACVALGKKRSFGRRHFIGMVGRREEVRVGVHGQRNG